MVRQFRMNNDIWSIRFVNPNDPVLIDRTGRLTVATTDPYSKSVYLSNELHDDFLIKVLIHELRHCVMVSYNLLADIRRVVPKQNWILAEEWTCNFIRDYGFEIFKIAYAFIGDKALEYLPYEFERLIA